MTGHLGVYSCSVTYVKAQKDLWAGLG